MSVLLIACNLIDGRAIIKEDENYFILNPPYISSKKENIKEKDVIKVINFYGFLSTNLEFENLDSLVKSIKNGYFNYYRDNNIRPIEQNQLKNLLNILDDKDIICYLEKIEVDLLPKKKIKDALNLCFDIANLKKVHSNHQILSKINNISISIFQTAINLNRSLIKEKSISILQLLAQKQLNLAQKLFENNSNFWKTFFTNGLECAYEGELFTVLFQLDDEARNHEEYDEKLLNKIKSYRTKAETQIKIRSEFKVPESFITQLLIYIFLLNENTFGKIRGIGNINKEFYLIQDAFLRESGYYLSIPFQINRNPVYSKELSFKINRYIKNKFLIRNSDKTLNLTPKSKRYALGIVNETKLIIESNFSKDLIKIIEIIVKHLGNKTSRELEEMEKKMGITPYNYGKSLF